MIPSILTRNAATLLACPVIGLLLTAGAVHAAPPAAPTGLTALSRSFVDPTTVAVTFSWEDNSDDETGFVLERFNGTDWVNFFGTSIGADQTEFDITGPFNGDSAPWRISAINAADEVSTPSNELVASTINGTVAATPDFAQVQIGEAVNFTVSTTVFTDPVITVAPLPDGVSFDAETNMISGAPTVGGFFAVTLTVREGITERKGTLGIAVIDPPVVISTPTPVGQIGSVDMVDLPTVFDDPDTETTAVVKTNLGDIPMTLYDVATPITSDNFKGYMDRGDWDDTIIHRSIADFIIQGGWLHPAGDKNFSFVDSQPQIVDEYDDSRPNVASTIAMARSGPNTATTNWFFNLRNNAQNLDFQDNGFTTFGRTLGDGMLVLDVIEALDTATYSNVTFEGAPTTMANLPLMAVTAGSPLESELVVVNSIERIAAMTYELVTNSDPSVVTASLTEEMLGLEYTGSGGESLITVAATDLDGARTETSFTVRSENSYAAWSAANDAGAAEENDDGGLLSNLQEYAFGGNPGEADDGSFLPTLTKFDDGEGGVYDAITFRQRRFTSDLEYKVQASTDLVEWTDLWTEENLNDVFAAAEVGEEFSAVTIRRIETVDAGGRRFFFRVVVGLAVAE